MVKTSTYHEFNLNYEGNFKIPEELMNLAKTQVDCTVVKDATWSGVRYDLVEYQS